MYYLALEDDVCSIGEREIKSSKLTKFCNKNILVVEDDPICYLLIKEILSPLGINLFQATCGKEAWDLLDSGLSYHLVLMDVVLPGETDGFYLSHSIKQRFPDLTIIIQSAVVNTKMQVMSVPGVYDGFIAKPYNMNLLREIVLNSLDRVSQDLSLPFINNPINSSYLYLPH